MEPDSHRLPEHLAAAVFSRAARLHLQSQGHLDSYSLAELLEAGQAANIPPEYIHQALHELHRPQPRRWRPLALALIAVTLGLGTWHYLFRPQPLPTFPQDVETLMRRKNCPQCSLSGADLRGKNLSNFNLAGANLRGADLTGANLSHANLQGADLRGAILDDTNLTIANLSGANLSGATINRANLTAANLQGVLANGTHIQAANLTGADLKAARLQGSNLTGTDLTKTNFQGADLDHVNMSGTILKNTDFRQAKNLETVDFSGAQR